MHCTALAGALAAGAAVRAPALAAASPRARVVLVVGDSLSAEYGLARGSGWVALLQQRLAQQHLPVQVLNASISGDTTAGGLSRLPALLAEHHPDVVVVELGGNDALRGLPLATTRDNLLDMVRAAQASAAKVVVVGMQLPPNYGRRYGQEFADMYAAVSQSLHAALVPFLLKGVADAPQADSLFQADRIHPTAAAHPQMLDNVWAVLGPLLTH